MSKHHCPSCGKPAPKALVHHNTATWTKTGRTKEMVYGNMGFTRTETVYEWRATPYRGNLMIVRRKPMNQGSDAEIKGETLTLWDGESYVFAPRCHPFCTSKPCAVEFARAAVKAGYERINRKRAS